jgi:ubiquinone/menaquinone biosynthesis C-methylase UbiE
MTSAKDHYSYQVYADPETARSFDRKRFGGPIGEFLKAHQEQLVFSKLGEVSGRKIIDVGAGTGRFTIPFLEKGAHVTACDASEEMLEVLKSKIMSVNLRTEVIDAHELPFPDQTFHCAVSFRMLMHVLDWRKALSELCRVSKDWVIFDLPPRRGFLRFAPAIHRITKPFRRKMQPYRVIPLIHVLRELKSHRFRAIGQDDGFFLPITAHRLIRSRAFTDSVEKIFGSVHLTKHFGSPVTVFARRSG